MVEGSCLCGQVRFRAAGPMRAVVACHCVQCRKTSGHFVAATSAPRASVEIEGEVTWYASSETAKRGFCGTCGSSLFWDGGGENLSIHAGSIDGNTGLATLGHIYTDDKGDYYQIVDDLPSSGGYDPDLTTRVP